MLDKADLLELKKFIRRTQPISPLTTETLEHVLRRFLLFQDCIELAIAERIGQPPPDESCDYIEQDYDRAEEILRLYPEIDA